MGGGTHLGWFCAEPGDTTTTTTTTTTTKFDPVCMARAERKWDDTRSNISVRNASHYEIGRASCRERV